ncbi:MAG: AAA domain-containing protein [Desulfobacteraceae bacterium]|nr:AAA domain-containing protein [Desulfobacteraceae bacterium]
MSKVKNFSDAILKAVQQEIFGMDEVVQLSLVALYTGGHVLLEGNPGMGKTELVKTLGNVLRLPFGRIQFTPDLMPADITGTYMPDFENQDSRSLKFREGPIFTSLLLADEINRATPKTQSAMLEAMAEQQVTVLGKIKKLEPPFMVLATQNPIDHEGTYNLPEAQADRFMFKVLMPVPDSNTLRLILSRRSGESSQKKKISDANPDSDSDGLLKDPEDSMEKYIHLRRIIEKVVPLPSLEIHILNMILASNRQFGEMEDIDRRQTERTAILVEELMTYGLGPRAAIAMMLGAKAFALMFPPNTENADGPSLARVVINTENADGPSLARVVIPSLRHRIKLDIDWEYRYRKIIKKDIPNETLLMEKMLADFCIATAPKKYEYQVTIKGNPSMKKYAAGEGW